jgi:hemolysin activation/secretion protein
VASQEWQIGGVDSVRGYSPGEAPGDQGFNASLELQLKPWLAKPYTFVAFIDHAYAYRGDTLISESDNKSLTGAGLGLRLFYSHPKVTGELRLDVGWPIGAEANTADDEPVLYLSTELRF